MSADRIRHVIDIYPGVARIVLEDAGHVRMFQEWHDGTVWRECVCEHVERRLLPEFIDALNSICNRDDSQLRGTDSEEVAE